MTDRRTVKPVKGRRIRDPQHLRKRPIPEEGKEVIWSPYWQRALAAGDITVVKDPEPKAPGKAEDLKA